MVASKGKTLPRKSLFKNHRRSPWPNKSPCRRKCKVSSTMVYLPSSSTEWSNYTSRCKQCLLWRASYLLLRSMRAIQRHRYCSLSSLTTRIKTSKSLKKTRMQVRRIARASWLLVKIRKTSTKGGTLSSWGTMQHRSCETTSVRCDMFSSNLLILPSNQHSCWSIN